MADKGTRATLDGVLDAIDHGDSRTVVELLAPLSEGQRKRLASKVSVRQKEVAEPPNFVPERDRLPPSPQRVAATTAVFGTCSGRAIAALFDWSGDRYAIDPGLAAEAAGSRSRAFANDLVERLLGPDFWQQPWSTLRALIKTGVVERPDDPRYTVVMVTSLAAWGAIDSVYRNLVEDPALLDDEVWRIFELDVLAELTLLKEPWCHALVRLAGEGRLDRARLLDSSLAALGRDFRASQIGWHGELHEALEPSAEERLERLSGYLRLMSSSNPRVVRYGLVGLEPIAEAVPPADLARAAAGPLALREKKYTLAMLRLLERGLKRSPQEVETILDAVAQGLGHARADVQERALKLLEAHVEHLAASPTVRSTMLSFAEGVSPVLRGRVDALSGVYLGSASSVVADSGVELRARLRHVDPRTAWGACAHDAVERADAGEWPGPRRVVMTPELLRRMCAPVLPVRDTDELIELAAVLLEGDGSAEDLERFLDGVSRFCGERGAGVKQRASAVLKRARELLQFGATGVSSAHVAAVVLCGWLEGDKKKAKWSGVDRVEEIALRAARAKARPLAALPTHEGGWIDPALFEERVNGNAQSVEAGWAAARATLAPHRIALVPRLDYLIDWRHLHRIEDRDLAAKLHSSVFVKGKPQVVSNRPFTDDELRTAGASDVEALRRNAGDVVLVFDAPGGESDPAVRWFLDLSSPERRGWQGDIVWAADSGAARWLMSMAPARSDVFLAIAAGNAFVFRDGNIVHGQVEAALERALDPVVEIGEAGWTAIAVCLLVKTLPVRRLACDVIVAAIADGRFEPNALAEALGMLLAEGVGNLRRLAEALSEVARVSDLHGAQMLRLLAALLPHLSAKATGINLPLELALELATRLDVSIDDPAAREALAAVVASSTRQSKAATAARALLDRSSGGERPWQLAAAAAVVDWAVTVEESEAT